MDLDHPNPATIDPVYMTSRTAKQIHDLSQVEKDIARLIRVAGTSVSLLTLPQTDGPEDKLPQGEERSEQFVIEVSEYFERLENIQTSIRSALAHIRSSQIAPSAIDAPHAGFVPSTLGVGLPSTQGDSSTKIRGFQEEKVERNAWNGVLEALTRLKEARVAERQQAKASEVSKGSESMQE